MSTRRYEVEQNTYRCEYERIRQSISIGSLPIANKRFSVNSHYLQVPSEKHSKTNVRILNRCTFLGEVLSSSTLMLSKGQREKG